MKKKVCGCLLLFSCFYFGAICLGNAYSAPEIRTVEYDIGNVESQKTYTTTVSFKNEYNEVFDILKVKKSCGCTDIKIKKDKVAPGEIFEFEVCLEISGPGYGEWIKQFTVISKRRPSLLYIVRLVGHFPKDAKIIVDPNQVFVGDIKNNTNSTFLMSLFRRDMSKLLFDSYTTTSEAISMNKASTEDIDHKGKYLFTLTIDSSKLNKGKFSEEVLISTKHDTYQKKKFMVSGNVISQIEVRPKRFFLKRFSGNMENTWSVKIDLQNFVDAKITSVSHSLGKSWNAFSKEDKICLSYTAKYSLDKESEFIKGEVFVDIEYENYEKESIEIPVIGIMVKENNT